MAPVVTSAVVHEVEGTESEYEYEYEDTATEKTYFVDIDISSASEAQMNHSINDTSQRTILNPFALRNPQENGVDSNADDAVEATNGGKSPPAIVHKEDSIRELQILELESNRPIILYNNRIYACTWHDLIGTNMFFAEHGDGLDLDSLSTDGNTDLLGISRIKLVARKAQLLPKHDPQKDNKQEDAGVIKAARGSGLGALSTSNPKINADMKKQAKFLEQLMEVKQSKGEVDNVRTIQPTRKRNAGSVAEGDKSSNQHKRQMLGSKRTDLEKEIQHWNRLTLRGDPGALERLEEIYGLLDDDEPSIVAARQHDARGDSEENEDVSPKRLMPRG